MKDEWALQESLRVIMMTTSYLHELAENGDVDNLNLYRIFLNNKIMEAVRLKKKLKNGPKN